ncbi:MAG TPA: hypothetical protein PKB10_03505, partial [Tepidisphaeraceae bacterium]|nr:hypothetical protein [Tepidisphaeraceae bacterium]
FLVSNLGFRGININYSSDPAITTWSVGTWGFPHLPNSYRHQKRANFVFLDGHVEALTQNEMRADVDRNYWFHSKFW